MNVLGVATTAKPDVARTPPHIPRQAFSHLPPIEYLISSPLTPPARRRHHPFPPLDDQETASLSEMLKCVSRHRSSQASVLPNIHKVTNGSYVPKRSIIVNWLIDVCASFKFDAPTLHLAVRHMDWFMSGKTLEQGNWQLCAVTSLFIAAKCEEAGDKVPIVDDLAYLCENIYSPAALRRMEVAMLSVLSWDLVVKTPVHFLTFFITAIRNRFIGEANLRGAEAHWNASMARKSVAPTRIDVAHDGFLWDDDSDDETYTAAMEDCECREECSCTDEEEDDDVMECDEEMALDYASAIEAGVEEGIEIDAMDEMQKVALCILELSLYDLDILCEFSPSVIAATALAMAVEITGVEGIEEMDIGTVTCVSQLDMAPCRAVLFEHFKHAQIAAQTA